jgi:hypothetical protein
VSEYKVGVSGGFTTTWVRKDKKGNIVEHEQTPDERDAHVVPKKGEYRLKVRGFAKPFEMNRAEQFGGGVQTMTRLELELMNGRDKGKVCTLLTGLSLSPRSNLGKVFTAITGEDLSRGGVEYDLADMLGGEFSAYLLPSDQTWDDGKPKGTRCSWDTVAAIGDDEDDAFPDE